MEGEVVAGTMEALLANVETMATTLITVLGQFVDAVIAEPFLLLGVTLMLVGAAVSFLTRLIHL